MADVSQGNANFIHGLSDLWNKFFKDRNHLKEMYKGSEILIGQAYLDILALVLNMSLRETPVFKKDYFSVLAIREDNVTERLTDHYFTFEVTDQRIKEIPFMYNKILAPDVIFENNIDYVIENTTEDLIVFYTDPFDYDGTGSPKPGIPTRTVEVVDALGVVTTKREISFWLPDVKLDGYDLYLNYGYLINRFEPSSESYRSLLKGVFQYFILGPTQNHITSALNVIVGFPVIRNDGEILQEVTQDGDELIISTDLADYRLPDTAPLRTDITETTNWAVNVGSAAALEFTALSHLTTVFTVHDVITDPTWWIDREIPLDLLPDESRVRRHMSPAVYENLIDNPPGLVNIGDPGVFIGADEDGFIPGVGIGYPAYTGPGYAGNTTTWRPTYRHLFAYIVFERFLKQHAFIVEFDFAAINAGLIPFDRLTSDMQSVIFTGKSAYTYMYAAADLVFDDFVAPEEDDVTLDIEMTSGAGWLVDTLEMFDSTFYIGSSAALIGDYYRYNVSGAVDVFPAPAPGPIPDAVGNTPLVIGGDDPTLSVAPIAELIGTGDWDVVVGKPYGKLQNAAAVFTAADITKEIHRPVTGDYHKVIGVSTDLKSVYILPIPVVGLIEAWELYSKTGAVGDSPVQITVT